eukprot:7384335-Prymnesium_polylepis.1
MPKATRRRLRRHAPPRVQPLGGPTRGRRMGGGATFLIWATREPTREPTRLAIRTRRRACRRESRTTPSACGEPGALASRDPGASTESTVVLLRLMSDEPRLVVLSIG